MIKLDVILIITFFGGWHDEINSYLEKINKDA